jgi:hypothetical protein
MNMTFRFDVIDIRTRQPEGDLPYVYVGRALMRAIRLNLLRGKPAIRCAPCAGLKSQTTNRRSKYAHFSAPAR